MNEQILLIICIFGAVCMVAFFVSRLLFSKGDNKLRSRLTASTQAQSADQVVEAKGVKPLLEKLGQAAAEPFMPDTREKQGDLRKRLSYAGIYSAKAVKVVVGAKVIFLCSGIVGGYLLGAWTGYVWLCLSMGGLVGYLLPTMWLKQKIKSNQRQLQYGLPDSLDLMVVCVEAGLTVDAAMQRVGQELAIAHPAISREFAITHMETRVGLARSEALKNLGARTGSQPLASLASMLAQAERFGTSIGQALRIHADSLRQSRQAAAEELAAKASVKMSFPLVLFIFPATFIVLAGPVVIGLMKAGMM